MPFITPRATLCVFPQQFFAGLIVALLLSGCGVSRQVRQAANLSKCEFKIVSVERINLAGVDFQHIKSINDLGMMDMAMILGGLASPVLPLSLQLNLSGRNPNPQPAGLNKMEWILFIDDHQVTSGILDKPFVIPPSGSLTIPVDVGLDLKQALSGESSTAVINFCLNLTGSGNTPTRFKVKIKPTIIVAGAEVTYPGFITVHSDYRGR